MNLVEQVEAYRLEVTRNLDRKRRSELGQFLTPPNVASFMASLFKSFGREVRVLDAGAGVGSLLAAFVTDACSRPSPPRQIDAVAYELDPALAAYLRKTSALCRAESERAGARFNAQILQHDFIAAFVNIVDDECLGPKQREPFTHAILNPPYKKLRANSAARLALRRVGIETSNLYTAFLSLAILLLEPGGELCAITPRSFCNGPYFRPFRELLLGTMALRRLHVFESRTAAFSDDEVLQENVILHAIKGAKCARIAVSSSGSPDDELLSLREVPLSDVVRPGDPERFIHVVPSQSGQLLAQALGRLPARLSDLGLEVSTGRVVDFRARAFLRAEPGPGAHPLIYPTHFAGDVVRWPKVGKKPNALAVAEETQDLFLPSGVYVLVKRFSSKEERRRVVAAIFDPKLVPAPLVGFENHLNVLHQGGGGLSIDVARGIAVFLNSTLFDVHFRQFNGHTQVNATDLRNLRYPALEVLRALGEAVADRVLSQGELDRLVETTLDLTS